MTQFPTPHEARLLAELLSHLADKTTPKLSATPLTAFLPITGNNYRHDLMLVGRAVNGWTLPDFPNGFSLPECKAPARAQAIAQAAILASQDPAQCPMQWIAERWHAPSNQYPMSRSAFFRLAKALIAELNLSRPTDPSWPSCLAWTNLYKLAPAHGGNPSDPLCRAILEDSIAIFHAELSARRPTRVLYLTGIDWARPFLPQHATPIERLGTFVEHAFSLNGQRHVVAKHPQAKPLRPFLDEVLAAFGRA